MENLLKRIKVIEFAKRWKVTRQAVYKLSKEGKLIVVKGYLDETISTNRQWIEGRQIHLTEQETDLTIPEGENSSPESLTSLKMLNLKLDAEFKTLRNNQKSNKLVELDLVIQASNQIYQQFTSNLSSQLEQLIRDVCFEGGLNNEKRTFYCAKLNKKITEASESAKTAAKTYMENIIEDYENSNN